MSMLNRYKKAGGFLQLVRLIETFGPQKREKFMALIEAEDPTWANALSQKLLSLERIFSWESATLSEIMARLPEKNLAVAIHGMSEDRREKVLSHLSHSEKRRLEGNLGEVKPTEGEIAASMVKVIEATRDLISSGALRVEHFDKGLLIEEDIEEAMASGTHYFITEEKEVGPMPVAKSEAMPMAAPSGAAASADTEILRQKVMQLQNENKTLKHDLKIAREKLDQIRKIA
jgi:hypothetical protein